MNGDGLPDEGDAPLEGVAVMLDGDRESSTGVDGAVRFTNTFAGEHRISISETEAERLGQCGLQVRTREFLIHTMDEPAAFLLDPIGFLDIDVNGRGEAS